MQLGGSQAPDVDAAGRNGELTHALTQVLEDVVHLTRILAHKDHPSLHENGQDGDLG